MESDAARSNGSILVLDMATASGLWVVRSASSTVYVLDLDRGLVCRARGEGSSAFAFDDRWVPLVRVTSRGESLQPLRTGEVRVGERPEYLTDPAGGGADYQWRIQRVVTAIEPIDEELAAALGARTRSRRPADAPPQKDDGSADDV